MLVVGLGNPGKQYENTRHNIGFIAVEALSRRYNFLWSEKSKFQGAVAEGVFLGKKLFLLKPNTYMNLSGSSVKSIASYYQIPTDQIFVIHDDIDLKPGVIKVKLGGGNGGHNGLKSLDMHLGNNYHRIRVGIGRPIEEEVSRYVLGSITKAEWNVLEESIDRICNGFDLLIKDSLLEFKVVVQSK